MPPQNQSGMMMPQKSGMPTWLKVVLILLVIGVLGLFAIIGAGYYVAKKVQNSISNSDLRKTLERVPAQKQSGGFASGDVATEIHKMFNEGKTPEEIARAFVQALKETIPAGAIDKTDEELYANALVLVKQELAVPTVK